jgi:hypothetical protein
MMKPNLDKVLKAGAKVQGAIEHLRKELESVYKGQTIYLPPGSVAWNETEGTLICVHSVTFFGVDDGEGSWDWKKDLEVIFLPEEEDNHELIRIELQYLDRLKFLV